jgi:hypothetical protein
VASAESITYYVLQESDERKPTGLFRDRRIPGEATYLERLEKSGAWVWDNGLIDYLAHGIDPGSTRVARSEARRIARRITRRWLDEDDTPHGEAFGSCVGVSRESLEGVFSEVSIRHSPPPPPLAACS